MRWRIGVDIGGTKIRVALVDEQGVIALRAERPTQAQDPAEAALLLIAEMLNRAPAAVAAIGVAVAGFIEYPSGRVAFAPNLQVHHRNLKTLFEDRFALPTAVDNDANAAAWGEHLFGAGVGVDDMLLVTVGTGIGGGVICGGRLYRGSRGFAGEFGHMPISIGGPECSCGARGCLEAWASGRALGALARERPEGRADSEVFKLAGGRPERITGTMVGLAADVSDGYALSLLAELGTRLGVGLAGLAKAFDPELIVVGGGVSEEGESLLGPARQELGRRFSGQVAPPTLVSAALGNDAGVVGAAHLAMSPADRRR